MGIFNVFSFWALFNLFFDIDQVLQIEYSQEFMLSIYEIRFRLKALRLD